MAEGGGTIYVERARWIIDVTEKDLAWPISDVA
jgi:hypothetical protein